MEYNSRNGFNLLPFPTVNRTLFCAIDAAAFTAAAIDAVFSKMNAGIIARRVPLSKQPTMDWDICKHFFSIWIDLQFDLCTIQPAFANHFNSTTSFTHFNGILLSFYPFEWILHEANDTHLMPQVIFYSVSSNYFYFIFSSSITLALLLSPSGMNWLFIREHKEKKKSGALNLMKSLKQQQMNGKSCRIASRVLQISLAS